MFSIRSVRATRSMESSKDVRLIVQLEQTRAKISTGSGDGIPLLRKI